MYYPLTVPKRSLLTYKPQRYRHIKRTKVHPRTGNEGPEGKQRYSSSISTSALDMGGGWSNAKPRPLYPPWKKHGTHCTEGWMGPKAGLDGCGRSRLPRDSIPGPVQTVASRHTDWAIPGPRRFNWSPVLFWVFVRFCKQVLKWCPKRNVTQDLSSLQRWFFRQKQNIYAF